jgi:hypothetical protein
MREFFAGYNHPAWLTMAGTVAGWTLMLLVVLVAFFVVPFLLWP